MDFGGGAYGVLSSKALSCAMVGTEDSRPSMTAMRKSGAPGEDFLNVGDGL